MNKSYYELNKQKIKTKNLEYYHKNKTPERLLRMREYNQMYYKNNKDRWNNYIKKPKKKEEIIEEKKEVSFLLFSK